MTRTLSDEDVEAIAQRVAALLSAPQSKGIDPNRIYDVAEAAQLVKLHPHTLCRKLRVGFAVKGKRKGGGHWRILGSELLKLA